MGRLKSLLLLAGLLGTAVVLLRLAGWLPGQLDGGRVRIYRTVEAAQRATSAPFIRMPIYFPKEIRWPPREVLAGSSPSLVVLTHFDETRSGEIGLAIKQAVDIDADPMPRIQPVEVLESSEENIEGNTVRVDLAICADGRPCNRLVWQSSGFSFLLVGRLPADELRRIVASML